MYKAVARALSATLLMLLSGMVCADLDEVARMVEGGRYQAALHDLNGLSAGDESRRSRLLQANALAGLKRSDEAEAIYRALIDEEPQDPTPYNNLASLYAAAGRLQEASELLTRAMKSDARYAAIYKNLSQVYVEMSRNSYARALRLGDQKKGLQLLSLDHRDAPLPVQSLQLAAVATPLAKSAPAPAQTAPAVLNERPPQPPQPTAAPQEFDAGGAIAALKQWAEAWSAQNVEGYLAAYDAEYLPPNGLTLAQWQAQRRVRLKKPDKIEVMLSDFEVSSSGGTNLTVKLMQRYRSDHYRDSTRKAFILVPRDGAWKIGDEYTIEVIN